MKKLLLTSLMVLLIAGIAGCGKEETVKIEKFDWNLTVVLSSEDGKVLGCAPEYYEAHKEDENIKEIELDCVASDGKYTIVDATNNTEYSGTYEIMEEDKESVIYSLTSEEGTGMAVTSITKSDDESKTPTLIVSLGGYDLNFQSEELE